MSALQRLTKAWGIPLVFAATVMGFAFMTAWVVSADEGQAVRASLEQAVQLLEQEELASASPEAQAEVAQTVLNLLEGEQGAIAYFEGISGRSAAELDTLGAQLVLTGEGEAPAVRALAHLLVARDLLRADPAPGEFDEALGHISSALDLLDQGL